MRTLDQWRAAFVLASAATSAPFCLPGGVSPRSNQVYTRQRRLVMSGQSDCCDCCNSTSQSSSNEPLVELPSVSVHRSRRKFIQYSSSFAAMAGLLGSPASAANGAAEIAANSQLASDKNIVAISGPLAPFSTTRSYRNIVLSNGLKVVLVKDTMARRSSVALSIEGAGQFAEPPEIPGLAHLMEHIVLSSTRARNGKSRVLERKARRLWNNGGANQMKQAGNSDVDDQEDFEEWLSENEGDSNAFTAPSFVTFHFNGPHEILPEGLERFARLFTLDEVETTITQKPFVVPREIQRVTDELDPTSDAFRANYFLKHNMNPDHPFARFSAGSKTTLETVPAEKGFDVPTELLLFFRDHYLASRATLVVVGKDELSALDRWVSPYSNVMAQKVSPPQTYQGVPSFPDPKLGKDAMSNSLKQSIILRSKDDEQIDENIQTLCLEWPLSLVYPNPGGRQIITTTALGFLLTQIISRRGPGSLRFFLEKFGWAPKGGSKGVPRISFPVDVSGFQVLRMEIGLTLDGFANRSAVISAVFESLRKDIESSLKLDLIKQYLAAGLLHGYLFAPRPPDSITLAVDSLRFGIGGVAGIGNANNNWYLMPDPEDEVGVENMRQVVSETLRTMSDDTIPLVSFRASPKAIFSNSGGTVDQAISVPPLFSPWKVEPITGARYYVESRANGATSYFRSLAWFAANFDGEELSPPYLNPLLPTRFRPPRPVIERRSSWGGNRYFYLEDASALEGSVRSASGSLKLTNVGTVDQWREMPTGIGRPAVDGTKWRIWNLPPPTKNLVGLPFPVRPPEPSIEAAFVVQLLSALPNSFTSSQLALANLWLLSFDDEVLDLAELGAIAGIAYESSMNTAGLRLSFRGPSQTLPSYVRRFCRRLVRHHVRLLDGTAKIPESVYQRAISDANRSPKISRLQKQQFVDTARRVSESEIGKQALFFLRCTNGGCLISQGDVLPAESSRLLTDLQTIFKDFGSADGFAVDPDLRALLYRPFWKPRDSSPCLLPGINLISDACGRVPR